MITGCVSRASVLDGCRRLSGPTRGCYTVQMAPGDIGPSDQRDFPLRVVTESIRLFAAQGYESTTVDQIAAAAGISRRTFFRQFGSKEDVIFADHEALLGQVAEYLAADDTDPWSRVCSAAEIVFTHFRDTRELAFARLRVVQNVPALRDRELVTTYRYQRLFEDFLRGQVPAESRVQIVAYAAAVTGAHNYLLRAMIRGDESATVHRLRAELAELRAALRSEPAATGSDDKVVTVVTYPAGTSADAIARQVRDQIGR